MAADKTNVTNDISLLPTKADEVDTASDASELDKKLVKTYVLIVDSCASSYLMNNHITAGCGFVFWQRNISAVIGQNLNCTIDDKSGIRTHAR